MSQPKKGPIIRGLALGKIAILSPHLHQQRFVGQAVVKEQFFKERSCKAPKVEDAARFFLVFPFLP